MQVRELDFLKGAVLVLAEHQVKSYKGHSFDEVLFRREDGGELVMTHFPDCYEAVWVEDVCGDLQDIIGSEILQASEVINTENDEWRYTFYKLATVKGHVTIRWCSERTGYYSESVDFEIRHPDGSKEYLYSGVSRS